MIELESVPGDGAAPSHAGARFGDDRGLRESRGAHSQRVCRTSHPVSLTAPTITSTLTLCA
jgi:hypothetical protein